MHFLIFCIFFCNLNAVSFVSDLSKVNVCGISLALKHFIKKFSKGGGGGGGRANVLPLVNNKAHTISVLSVIGGGGKCFTTSK